MNGPDPLRVEHLLAAAHHVLQEVDGHIVCEEQGQYVEKGRNLPYGGRYTSHSTAKKL